MRGSRHTRTTKKPAAPEDTRARPATPTLSRRTPPPATLSPQEGAHLHEPSCLPRCARESARDGARAKREKGEESVADGESEPSAGKGAPAGPRPATPTPPQDGARPGGGGTRGGRASEATRRRRPALDAPRPLTHFFSPGRNPPTQHRGNGRDRHPRPGRGGRPAPPGGRPGPAGRGRRPGRGRAGRVCRCVCVGGVCEGAPSASERAAREGGRAHAVGRGGGETDGPPLATVRPGHQARMPWRVGGRVRLWVQQPTRSPLAREARIRHAPRPTLFFHLAHIFFSPHPLSQAPSAPPATWPP